ncbi:uncharacterized protein WM277_019480 [Molossus nigricans]
MTEHKLLPNTNKQRWLQHLIHCSPQPQPRGIVLILTLCDNSIWALKQDRITGYSIPREELYQPKKHQGFRIRVGFLSRHSSNARCPCSRGHLLGSAAWKPAGRAEIFRRKSSQERLLSWIWSRTRPLALRECSGVTRSPRTVRARGRFGGREAHPVVCGRTPQAVSELGRRSGARPLRSPRPPTWLPGREGAPALHPPHAAGRSPRAPWDSQLPPRRQVTRPRVRGSSGGGAAEGRGHRAAAGRSLPRAPGGTPASRCGPDGLPGPAQAAGGGGRERPGIAPTAGPSTLPAVPGSCQKRPSRPPKHRVRKPAPPESPAAGHRLGGSQGLSLTAPPGAWSSEVAA